jgi:asparagine synthase (glutamine-hydrolysing)
MNRHELSPLEVASGLVFGLLPAAEVASAVDPPADPLEALEAAVRPALERVPCVISFSGGRDSSAVLAVATHVARREGLPLPIPSTNRFPEAPDSNENDWQERVIRHLGLADWARPEFTDELDNVGPVAGKALRRHGLLWPFNAHFHVPQLEAARGGSLLTGIAGDEMLSPSSWERTRAVLTARARPSRRDLRRIGFLATPGPIRRAILRRRYPLEYSWLRPHVLREITALSAAEGASEPVGWKAQLGWRRRFRYLQVGLGSLALLAADADVRIVHPFFDPGFAASVAGLPRAEQYGDRTTAMRRLFGSLLPDDLLARTTKSGFDQAFWGEPSRAFAADWDGKGVDPELVDADALRREWALPAPDPRSFLLLQAAWLARAAGRSDYVVPVALP